MVKGRGWGEFLKGRKDDSSRGWNQERMWIGPSNGWQFWNLLCVNTSNRCLLRSLRDRWIGREIRSDYLLCEMKQEDWFCFYVWGAASGIRDHRHRQSQAFVGEGYRTSWDIHFITIDSSEVCVHSVHTYIFPFFFISNFLGLLNPWYMKDSSKREDGYIIVLKLVRNSRCQWTFKPKFGLAKDRWWFAGIMT